MVFLYKKKPYGILIKIKKKEGRSNFIKTWENRFSENFVLEGYVYP